MFGELGAHRVSERSLVPLERIDGAIRRLRGHSVMLDADLAALYQVPVKALNQAVKRNRRRFPEDFMIRVTTREEECLRSQIVTLKNRRGRHRKYPLHAFTEQGVAMLSSVLRSRRAVRVNIEIMRAFVRFRRALSSNAELTRKLDALEEKYDAQFSVVFQAIRELMAPRLSPRRRIGFNADQSQRSLAVRDRATSPRTAHPHGRGRRPSDL